MSVEFIGMRKLASGLVGKPVAQFVAPASAVKYDRGSGSGYFFSRRQYIKIGSFARGEADGRVHRSGDILCFRDVEVMLY